MNLTIEKSEFLKFKRRARTRYPKEHLEALWGKCDETTIFVEKFVPLASITTTEYVQYTISDFVKVRREAKRAGYEFLGTIHTHCGNDAFASMSRDDNHTAHAGAEKVCGILHFYKKDGSIRSNVGWSLPTSYV